MILHGGVFDTRKLSSLCILGAVGIAVFISCRTTGALYIIFKVFCQHLFVKFSSGSWTCSVFGTITAQFICIDTWVKVVRGIACYYLRGEKQVLEVLGTKSAARSSRAL